LKHLVFRPGIHAAGGFIQNDQLGLAQKGPGQGHFLPLALAEFSLVLKLVTQNGLVAPGQLLDKIIGPGLPSGMKNLIIVSRYTDVSQPDIFPGRQAIAGIILENDADLSPDGNGVKLAQVNAVNGYSAAYRIIETAEELDKGRFSRAILTHQRYHLAG
jgi:hypothetical protein